MQPVAYLGLFIIALILLEAFETVVLPRRVTRWFRVTRLFYSAVGTVEVDGAAREASAPARDVFEFLRAAFTADPVRLWGAGLLVGFALVYYGNEAHDPRGRALQCVST